MKKMLTAASMLASCALMGANLLFYNSFDKGLEADVANGNAEPLKVTSYDAAFVPGVSGKALRIGPWKNVEMAATTDAKDIDFSYVYSAESNVNAAKGAIAFWIKPVDWDGKDASPHRLFVQLMAPNQATMTIYKVLNMASLYCHTDSKGVKNGGPMGRIDNWKKDEWHHVVVNWYNGNITGFIDGAKTGSIAYEDFNCTFKTIIIGCLGWQFESGASAMDDFRVYDAPLNGSEIEDLLSGKGNEGAEFRLNVGKVSKAPVVDGVINKDEYVLGATGFYQFSKHDLIPAELQPQYFLSHDGEKLYIAVKSPAPANPKTQQFYGRDGNVWEDETIEIHIDNHHKKNYQFILNTADGIYDSLNGDTKWNAKNLEYKNNIKDGVWTIECSIPLKELEFDGKSFGMNICRSYQTPQLLSCVVPVKHAYAEAGKFCKVNLVDAEYTPVQLLSTSGYNRKSSNIISRAAAGGRCTVNYGPHGKDEAALGNEPIALEKDGLDAGLDVVVRLSDAGGNEVYANAFNVARFDPVTLEYVYTDIPTNTVKFAMVSLLAPNERGILKLDVTKRFGGELVETVELSLNGYEGTSFDVPYPADHLPNDHYVFTGRYVSPLGETSDLFIEEWVKPERQVIIDYAADERVKVQDPWKPLVQDGNKLATAFHDVSFGKTYIDQIHSLSRGIFAGESFIEVNGVRDGGNSKTVLDNHGDYCHVTQTMEYGDVMVTLASRMEFDGMVKTSMTLAPRNGSAKLDTFKLCFPLNAASAKYVNAFNGFGNGFGKSGILSDDKEWRTDLFRLFMFWIGDDKVGFSWVCKNTKGWHCRETGKSFQLLKAEEGSRLAVLNIVDSSFELKEPRTIEFAVMASPGRPNDPVLQRTQFRVWNMWSGYYSLFYDYHEPGFLTKRVGNPNYFHYVGIGTSPHGPAYNYYQQDWNTGILGKVEEDIIPKNLAERNRVHYWSGCFNSQSFLNYKIDRVKFIINYEPLNLYNLYFDLMRGRACASKSHGCSWTDDFRRDWQSYDWEGRRVFLREIRAELKKKNPKGYISLHTHNQRLPMILSFGDMHVGGEDFVFEVGRSGNYYDVVNSDVLRAYSVAYGSGLKCLFIPQLQRSLMFVKPGTTFDEDLPENIWATRHIAMMLFLHDIDGWTVMKEFKRIWDFETEFGWDKDTVFEPFWDNHGLYEVVKDASNGKLVPAVYRRDGRFLLGLLNDSSVDNQVAMKLNLQALLKKDAPSKVRDMFNPDRKLTVKDGVLELNMKPREGLIIWIE